MEQQQSNNLPAPLTPRSSNLATLAVFSSMDSFGDAQRIATALAKSSMVPDAYRENIPNCLIALEYAGQVRMSVMAVMQNLHIIQGRPSWSAPFLIATVNSTGLFTPLRYEKKGDGKLVKIKVTTWEGPKDARKPKETEYQIPDIAYRVKVTERATGTPIYGPWVSMEMAYLEGWALRPGNKYKTLPDQMLSYRAAAFFTRLYCPELSMGMHTTEEAQDAQWTDIAYEDVTPGAATVVEKKPRGAAGINAAIKDKPPVEPDASILPEQGADDESGMVVDESEYPDHISADDV